MSAVTPFLRKTADNPDGVDPKIFKGIEEAIRKDRFAFLKSFGPKFYGRSALQHTVSDAELEWDLRDGDPGFAAGDACNRAPGRRPTSVKT